MNIPYSTLKTYLFFFITIVIASGCVSGRTKVAGVNDQKVLEKIALDDKGKQYARTIAIIELTNQKVLEKIAWEDKDLLIREEAVKNITDQNILAKIALSTTLGTDMPLLAVRRITEQKMLGEIALTSKNCSVCKNAVGKITEQKMLIQIVLEKLVYHCSRIEAVKNITDQKILGKLVLEEEDWRIRIETVRRVTDQKVLEKVALEEEHYAIRFKAVQKVTNQTVLGKVAVKDEQSDTRKEATKKVTDQKVLEKIALEDESWYVRKEAVKKITNENILEKIALKDKDWRNRQIATKKIVDQAVLEKIAIEDEDQSNRQVAKKQMEAIQIATQKQKEAVQKKAYDSSFAGQYHNYMSAIDSLKKIQRSQSARRSSASDLLEKSIVHSTFASAISYSTYLKDYIPAECTKDYETIIHHINKANLKDQIGLVITVNTFNKFLVKLAKSSQLELKYVEIYASEGSSSIRKAAKKNIENRN